MRWQRIRRQVVDGAGEGEGIIGNEVQTVLGIGDALLEILMELLGSGRFARGRQTGDDDQLKRETLSVHDRPRAEKVKQIATECM